MNKYELIYIIDTTVEETARKELIEKFNGIIAANGGEVVKGGSVQQRDAAAVARAEGIVGGQLTLIEAERVGEGARQIGLRRK